MALVSLLLGAALQGVLWGLAGTILLPASPLSQLFLGAVLGGVTAGSVITLAPLRSAYALLAVPAIVPLCCRLLGGDLQIGARLAQGQIDVVIFLRDPMTAQPHEPDINALVRACDVHDVPCATNLSTARLILQDLAH